MANKYGIPDELYSRAKSMADLKYRSALQAQAGSSRGYAGGSVSKDGILAAEIEKVMGSYSASGGSSGGATQASESSSSSFSGIQDPEIRTLLKGLVTQMNSGGTAGQKEAKAAKDKTVAGLDEALGNYSKQSAFTDSLALIQQSLAKTMEANKPAIQKAIEGSGTSSGSMQALLSQRLATDASTQAGALGAEQAKAYGQIATNLLNTRGGLTNGVDQTLDPMTKILDLLKISTQQSSSTSNFSPQQMNVETQADKLAQIAAQNAGALDRTNAQVAGQLAGASGGSVQMPTNPFASMDALIAGANNTAKTSSSLAELLKLAGAPATVGANQPVSTTPAYMNLTNTTDPSNPYGINF